MANERNTHAFGGGTLDKAATDDTPYLGDVKAVEALLRNEAGACLKLIGTPGYQGKLMDAGQRIAKAILGRDPAWSKVDGWNEPGAVDEFVAKWAGVTANTPEDRITGAFLRLVSDLLDLEAYAQSDGVLPENWTWQVDGAFSQLAMIMCGVDLPTQAAM